MRIEREENKAVMAKNFCLCVCNTMQVPGGLELVRICVFMVGRRGDLRESNRSNYSSPVATSLLRTSRAPHCSLCWQQSLSPSWTGLGRCMMALVTELLTTQGSSTCCSCFHPCNPHCSSRAGTSLSPRAAAWLPLSFR